MFIKLREVFDLIIIKLINYKAIIIYKLYIKSLKTTNLIGGYI